MAEKHKEQKNFDSKPQSTLKAVEEKSSLNFMKIMTFSFVLEETKTS